MKNKETIFNLRKTFMLGSSPVYTQFDYREGDLNIKILPIYRLLGHFGAEVAGTHLTRMERSRGRIQLNVVLGRQGCIFVKRKLGKISFPWLFPMRSSSSRLHDGLGTIVAHARAGRITEVEQTERIKNLVNNFQILELD